MPEEESKKNDLSHQPNFGNIEKVYDELDKVLVDLINKHNFNFLEIEILFLMFREKFELEKLKLYSLYQSEISDVNRDMYR